MVLIAVFVVTFLGTVAVLNRHQLVEHFRVLPASSASQAIETSASVSTAAPGIAGPAIQGNIGRAMACIPANVLSAAEIEQLNEAIEALPASSPGSGIKALSADSFDPHKMTTEQARETLQILAQIKGPLGDKALQAMNQSVSEGPCKIRDNAVNQPATAPSAPLAPTG